MQAIDPIMLALLGFVLLFVPITGGLMAATPYLMPKRECFAVTIPDAASNDPEIKHLKRSYFTVVIVVRSCLHSSSLCSSYASVATLSCSTFVKRRSHSNVRGAGKRKQPSA